MDSGSGGCVGCPRLFHNRRRSSFRASPTPHCTHGSSANSLTLCIHCMPTPQSTRAYAQMGTLPLHWVELGSKVLMNARGSGYVPASRKDFGQKWGQPSEPTPPDCSGPARGRLRRHEFLAGQALQAGIAGPAPTAHGPYGRSRAPRCPPPRRQGRRSEPLGRQAGVDSSQPRESCRLPGKGRPTTTTSRVSASMTTWWAVSSSGRLQGRPRCGSPSSRRTEATNLLKQRELSPVKGSIQDGTDAVVTPATT